MNTAIFESAPLRFAEESSTWAHPEWAGAVVAVVATAGVALAAAQVSARRRARRLGTRGGAGSGLRDALRLAALAAIGIALLGPQLGERWVAVPARGIDVVFALDVSRSMDATDVAPTRFDRARRTVEELLGRLKSDDRAALAVFADRGVVLAPLTPDRHALLDLLDGLETGWVEPASSNLARGVEAASSAFDTDSERPRAVVVVSDGEDSRGEGDLGAETASREGARVFTFALGTPAGAHVPDGSRVLLDRDGRPVVTRPDPGALARLAAATGGRAFESDEWGRFDFDLAAAALTANAGDARAAVSRRVAAPSAAPFAVLAFAILCGEALRGRSPRARRTRPASARRATAARAVLLAGTVSLPFAIHAESPDPPTPSGVAQLERAVRDEPTDARARIDLGLARLALGEVDAAAEQFLLATVHAREPDVAATASFDLGVAALAREDWLQARDAFFDALAIDPDDGAARFNLEWTLAALRRANETGGAESSESETPPPAPARPEASPAEPDATGGAAPDSPHTLSRDERRAWLARATDDSQSWLRAQTDEARDRAARDEPAW